MSKRNLPSMRGFLRYSSLAVVFGGYTEAIEVLSFVEAAASMSTPHMLLFWDQVGGFDTTEKRVLFTALSLDLRYWYGLRRAEVLP